MLPIPLCPSCHLLDGVSDTPIRRYSGDAAAPQEFDREGFDQEPVDIDEVAGASVEVLEEGGGYGCWLEVLGVVLRVLVVGRRATLEDDFRYWS